MSSPLLHNRPLDDNERHPPGDRGAGGTFCTRLGVIDIRLATENDFERFLDLACEVEDLFGPMVDSPDFHKSVRRNIARGSALVACSTLSARPSGGLLFANHRNLRYTISWLVVASAERSSGVGQALVAEAVRLWVTPPAVVDVVTFGEEHPGARSRRFYDRIGFEAAEPVENGPDGGSRQIFRLHLLDPPAWSLNPGG